MATWNQATPPPAGVTYTWEGAPHDSVSVKRDGRFEVARNLVSNPSFEVTSQSADRAISSGWQSDTLVRGLWAAHGDNSWGLVAGATANRFTYFGKGVIASGSWVAFNTTIQASTAGGGGTRYFAARVGSRVPGLGSYEYSDHFPVVGAAPGAVVEVGGAYKLPDGHTQVQVIVYVYSQENGSVGPVEGWIVRTDGFHVASADTEDAALAQVETYFDGSFEDDREGETWFSTITLQEHYWGGYAAGWVPMEDKIFHPLNGVEHEWLGEPHNSTSVKRVGAVEVSQNRVPNPRYRRDADGWAPNWSAAVEAVPRENLFPSFGSRLGVDVLRVTETSDGTGSFYAIHGFPIPEGDRRIALSVPVHGAGRVWLYFEDADGARVLPQVQSNVQEYPEGGTLTLQGAVPEGAVWCDVYLGSSGSAASTVYFGPAHVATGDTREEVLEKVRTYFDGDTPSTIPGSGITEAGVATVDRRGLVSETFARSREKIDLQLAEPDERLKGGERIELAAFAASSSEVTWRWRQVTGPEVLLVREGNTCHFQAPDVDDLTDMRIAVSASSVDGANRSDWHYFDLEVRPTVGRFAAEGSDGFLPYTPQMVGYNRGKREIWNDVIAPVGMDPEGRKEPKLVDLGIPADDVTFSLDGEEPARASAGAVYVDIRDGAIYRNFGGGYNETDDTTGAPRLNAYMVNPATGEVFEWIEGADNGR